MKWNGTGRIAGGVSSRAWSQARAAGARIAREPAKTFYGGYAGVFLDLDGHPWEVAYNPDFPLSGNGELRLPQG